MNPHLDDTIIAIATPTGRGGLGVVRMAGEQAANIAGQMLRMRTGKYAELEAGRAVFANLVEPTSGEHIDEVVVTYFKKPHSYTTDDIVEISAHGSPVVLRHIVEQAIAKGARLAEPGEFTMRAFLRGRIDLTQAEAVRDLIESQTLFQAKAAAQQLEGALSKRLRPIKQELLNLIATLEAGVDFAEDDVAVLPDEEIMKRIESVRMPLEKLSESIGYGKMVHKGITLAIVGRPNVGKSSLFNRLIERDHAIVTATPGTTRDLVSETVSLGGIPVKLIDTAGLRESHDEAEKIGIRKSYEALADADIVLAVLEAGVEHSGDTELIAIAKERGGEAIVVENKADLMTANDRVVTSTHARIRTSALHGHGIAELRAEILRRTSGGAVEAREPGFLTNERQHNAVEQAVRAVQAAEKAVRDGLPHEVLLLDLYAALRRLDEITGATSNDDILALIFSGFCIGK